MMISFCVETNQSYQNCFHKTNILIFFVNSFDVHSNLILDKDMKFNLNTLEHLNDPQLMKVKNVNFLI